MYLYGQESCSGRLMNLKVNFLLDDIRGDPRFSTLLKKMDLKK
jgi:hypothetical protein